MKKLKCYYAHTMLSYGSTIEARDIETLETLGFEVVNPNTPEIAGEVAVYVSQHGPSRVMEFFDQIVKQCDLLAFRSVPNGDILSGIASEINSAIFYNIPVIELPCSLEARMLDYPKTKQFLIEVGHYKLNK